MKNFLNSIKDSRQIKLKLISVLGMIFISSFASATITKPTITLEVSTKTTESVYDVSFITSVNLTSGDKITIRLPNLSNVSQVNGNNRVFINGIGVANAQVTTYEGTLQDSIELVITNATAVTAGSVLISLGAGNNRIINPTVASTNYTASINTSKESTKVDSYPYTILESTAITFPNATDVTIGSSVAGSTSSYSLFPRFWDGTAGLPFTAGDQITVQFPSNTIVPLSMDTSKVRIVQNGGAGTTRYISAITTNQLTREVTLTLKTGFTSSTTTDEIRFSSTAGLINPTTAAGTYTVQVKNSLQTTYAVSNNNYTITAATTMTTPNVVLSPTTVNTTSQYTVSFSVGNTGALTSGSSTITLTFPSDTKIPASITSGGNIKVNGSNVSGTITTDVVNRTIVLTTPVAVANSGSVSVLIASSAGIKNPTSIGSSFVIAANTSVETTPKNSNTYSTTASTITAPTVALVSQQPGVSTQNTVTFNVGAAGELVANSSTITVDFPDATSFNEAQITAGSITVNGTSVSQTPSVNTTTKTITITSPTTIADNGSVTVVFNSGISNPSTSNYYTLTAYTSQETTPITSGTYLITPASAVTNITVTPTTAQSGTNTNYTITFKNTSALAAGDYIYLTFDNGYSVNLNNTNRITVNGVNPTALATDRRGSRDRLNIEIANTTIAANSTITIVTTNNQFGNPATAYSGYTLNVSTSKDALEVDSPTYEIKNNTAFANLTVSASPSTSNTYGAYTIGFDNVANSNLRAGFDKISMTFPAGTTVPDAIAVENVTVNGVTASAVTSNSTTRVVTITTGVAIASSATGNSIVINSNAGIKNPTVTSNTNFTITLFGSNISLQTLTSGNYQITTLSQTSPSTVVVNPDSKSGTSAYSIDFSVGSASSNLAAGDSILIVFPSTTILPSSPTAGQITVNGTAATTVLTQISNSGNTDTLIVLVPTGVTIANNGTVSLAIGSGFGLKNPTTTGAYFLKIRTNKNTTYVTGNTFQINDSYITTPTVTPSPSTVNSNAQYTVAFNTGTGGALLANTDNIYLIFPSGTTIPSTIANSGIKVNGVDAFSVSTQRTNSANADTVIVTTPSNISAGGSISIVISTAAGIYNPVTASSSNLLKVYTTKETTVVNSGTYVINSSSAVSNVSVAITNPTASQTSKYSISFNVGSSGISASDSIYVTFPTATTIGALTNAQVLVGGAVISGKRVTSNLVVLKVPAGISRSANDTISVVFNNVAANITNPAIAKTDYSLSVRHTSSTATSVSSLNYTIISGLAPTAGNVLVSPNFAADYGSYAVKFTTRSNSFIKVGDRINIVFPVGTVLPSSINSSEITVNGTSISQSPTIQKVNGANKDTISILSPVEVSSTTLVTVIFGIDAQIKNPSAATYTGTTACEVNTATDNTFVNENAYVIAASTNLTSSSVVLGTSTVNTVSSYTLSFANGTTAFSGSTTDSIVITFPSGTNIPANISASSVTYNGNTPTRITTDPANRKISVVIPTSTPIAASAGVSLIFSNLSGITNPITSGANYTLTVQRNNGGTAITSNVYAVTASQVTSATVSVAPSTIGSAGAYSINFSVGAGGGLTVSSSTITITFPSGTVLPASIAANEIQVNSTPVSSTPAINTTTRTLTFTSPVNVANNGSVAVAINSTGNILNPTTTGTTYTLGINTSIEPTSVTSQVYAINSASDVSIAVVSLSNNIVNTSSVYTVKFKTNTAFSNSTRIVVSFPSSTGLGAALNTASNIMIKKNYNGTAVPVDSSGVTGLQVTVRVPTAAGFSSATDTCYLIFNSGITNTTVAGTNKTLSVRTTTTSFVTSSKFSVLGNTSVTSITVTPSPNTSGSVASYSISFTTQSALVTGDLINLTFPAGTSIPGSITASKISVNGVSAVQDAIINGQIISVSIPSNLSAATSTTVVFNSTASISNPSANTNYVVGVTTSTDNNSANSAQYTIINSTNITASTVALSNSTVNTVSSYTLDFTNGTAAISSGGTFVITFPSGTTVPAGITSNVTVSSGSPLTSKTVTSVASNNGSRTITITMGATIAASDPIRISVASAAGIINPTTASSSNTLSIAATGNGSANSNTYTTNASTVSAATVTLSSTATSATANYTISFTTGAGGALVTGNTITVVFPTGTGVSSASTANTTINGGAPTAVNVTGQSVVLTFSSVNSGAIGNNAAVTLVFNSRTNPSSANANASVTVKTTAEATAVTSNTYQITTGTTVSTATVTLGVSTNTASTLSQYTIVFNLGSAGALTTGSTHTISIVFPSGTTLGSALSTASNTTLNGVTPQSVSVSSQTVTITKTAASATIANSGTVTIVFSNTANMITNPATAQSNYTVGVSTSIEPTIITSNKYKIIANSNTMTSAAVTPSDNLVSHNSTYQIVFTIGSNGKLLLGDKVYLNYPSGFTIAQIAAGNVQVNSTPTTVATTVAGQQFAVTLPVNVNASTSLTIDLLDATKITNSSTANYYTLGVSSDIETATKTSQSFGIPGLDGSLSVELTDFAAKSYRGGAMIEWTTASELNNAFFKLFRKEKGTREFDEVAKISGKGTTSEESKYRFVDSKLESGKVYEYQLRDYAFDGQIRIHDIVEVELEIPKTFNLEQNFPNPFNPQTIIPYSVPVDSRITIEIYNILGQKVKTLVNDNVKAGSYYPEWNGKNDNGVTVASGVYFVHMQTSNQANNFSKTLKMTMMK